MQSVWPEHSSISEVCNVKATIWFVSGALSFWLPIILVFAIGRSNTSIVLANVLAVFAALFCYAGLRWRYHPGRVALWMLVGVYVLGPILLSTATSFVNGGFSQIHSWRDIAWLSLACVFPPLELLLVGTSGLWPSLLVVTAVLGSATAVESKF